MNDMKIHNSPLITVLSEFSQEIEDFWYFNIKNFVGFIWPLMHQNTRHQMRGLFKLDSNILETF
jgi:hypothetical protein